MKCIECGGDVVLASDGTYVCTNCGLVQGYVQNPSCNVFERKISGPIYYDGLEYGSLIFKNSRLKKIARKNIHVKMRNGLLMEMYAINSINIVCEKLGLSKTVKDRAIFLYRKFAKHLLKHKKNLLGRRRLNHYRLAALALIFAGEELGINVRTKDVVEAYKSLRHNVSVGNIIEASWLIRHAGIYKREISLYTRTKNTIKIFNAKSGFKYNRALNYAYLIASNIIEKIDRLYMQGKKPRTIAAAVAFISLEKACRNTGIKPPSLSSFAKSLGYSSSALRERINEISLTLKV